MNSKTGMVMEIKNNSAHLLTPDGEFVSVKIKGRTPSIGSTYSGEVPYKLPFYKYALTACLLLLFSLGGSGVYAYYTPVASIVVKINPSVEMKINRWNKIIKTLPLNEDGKTILSSINLENKSVDEGLNLILEEADKENFIKDEASTPQQISVSVNSDKSLDLNITEFENKVKDKHLQLEVKYTEPTKSNKRKQDVTNSKKDNNKIIPRANTTDKADKEKYKEDTHNILNNDNKAKDIPKINDIKIHDKDKIKSKIKEKITDNPKNNHDMDKNKKIDLPKRNKSIPKSNKGITQPNKVIPKTNINLPKPKGNIPKKNNNNIPDIKNKQSPSNNERKDIFKPIKVKEASSKITEKKEKPNRK